MTTIASHALAPAGPAATPAPPIPTGAALIIAWPIHPDALRAAPALADILPPRAGAPTAIEWRITGDRARAHLAIGETRIAIPAFEGETRWELDSDTRLWSVDTSRDGRTLLSATIAPGDPARLLYVRTPIFADFKIPGGRYGPAIATVSVA